MADAKPKPKPKDYDERIYRKGHPPHRIRNALILIGWSSLGTYLAVTKELPFGGGYEVKAVFENAANIRKDSRSGSPASTSARCRASAASATPPRSPSPWTRGPADPQGRPGRDPPAHLPRGQLLPRREAGQPERARGADGGTIPITQTSTAVQLDQILTTLQAPDRENL